MNESLFFFKGINTFEIFLYKKNITLKLEFSSSSYIIGIAQDSSVNHVMLEISTGD